MFVEEAATSTCNGTLVLFHKSDTSLNSIGCNIQSSLIDDGGKYTVALACIMFTSASKHPSSSAFTLGAGSRITCGQSTSLKKTHGPVHLWKLDYDLKLVEHGWCWPVFAYQFCNT